MAGGQRCDNTSGQHLRFCRRLVDLWPAAGARQPGTASLGQERLKAAKKWAAARLDVTRRRPRIIKPPAQCDGGVAARRARSGWCCAQAFFRPRLTLRIRSSRRLGLQRFEARFRGARQGPRCFAWQNTIVHLRVADSVEFDRRSRPLKIITCAMGGDSRRPRSLAERASHARATKATQILCRRIDLTPEMCQETLSSCAARRLFGVGAGDGGRRIVALLLATVVFAP